jgi:hypothetical protein
MIFAILIIVISIAIVSLRRKSVGFEWVQNIRVFFPSWRFFEDLGGAFYLEVRQVDGALTDWLRVSNSPQRHGLMFVFNPEVNIALSLNSSLEILAVKAMSEADLLDGEDGLSRIDEKLFYSDEYRVVAAAAWIFLQEQSNDSFRLADLPNTQPIESGKKIAWQFRVLYRARNQQDQTLKEILVSPQIKGAAYLDSKSSGRGAQHDS